MIVAHIFYYSSMLSIAVQVMPHTPPKKVPRRIVPIAVPASPPKVVRATREEMEHKYDVPDKMDKWDKKAAKHMKKAKMEGGRSVTYEKHLAAVHEKDYADKVRQRAIELGYESAKKPRKSSGSSKATKKKNDDRDHGSYGIVWRIHKSIRQIESAWQRCQHV
jgi:hypothetical protein